MKKTLILTLISCLIFSITLSAQKVDLPLKNGMVYFSTGDITLPNTKRCLCEYQFYMDPTSFLAINSDLRKESKNKAKFISPEVPSVGVQMQSKFAGACASRTCQDTLKGTFSLILPGNLIPNYWNYFVKKRRVATVWFTGTAQLIYISKNQYRFVIKGINIKTVSIEGYEQVWEEFEIEKAYNDYLKLEKPDKQESYMYEDLQRAVVACQNLVRKTLESAYKLDELD